jgi:hypothetical protein
MKRKKTQNLGLKQRLTNSSPVEREDLISGLPYSIGYAKPPPSSQFKPGQSGNRRGRSKGYGDLGKLLEDELNVTVEVAESGRRHKLSKAQISVRQLANKSAGGDLRAFQAAVDILRKTGRLRENPNETPTAVTAADVAYDFTRLSDAELLQLESILTKMLPNSAFTADTNEGGECRNGDDHAGGGKEPLTQPRQPGYEHMVDPQAESQDAGCD